LAVAVFLQRRELELQRRELRQTRDALKLQADELEENAAQAKALEASQEYARQEVIIRVSESGSKRLGLLACEMWHFMMEWNRAAYASGSKTYTESNWQRYADGDTEIWFAVLIEVIDDRTSESRVTQTRFAELANSFVDQCNDIQQTLRALNASPLLVKSFDEGLIGDVRRRLSSLGLLGANDL
jgi:hypothetical protein